MIYLSIYLSLCLSVYLSICLSVYLSMVFVSTCDISIYVWYLYLSVIFLSRYFDITCASTISSLAPPHHLRLRTSLTPQSAYHLRLPWPDSHHSTRDSSLAQSSSAWIFFFFIFFFFFFFCFFFFLLLLVICAWHVPLFCVRSQPSAWRRKICARCDRWGRGIICTHTRRLP